MAKINQIQKKLKELSGGEFPKLADFYLHKKLNRSFHLSVISYQLSVPLAESRGLK